MVQLEKMTSREFEQFRLFSIDNYAKALCRNLRVTYRAALEMARSESAEALPHGYYTEGHNFFTAQTVQDAENVGYVWYVVNEKRKSAFLYDIYIAESYRGRGLAKTIMLQVENNLRRKGVQHFRLNVFADNVQARQLYDQLGFEPSNTIMQKKL